MFRRDVTDEFLDQNRFADAGAAEETDLPTFEVGSKKVNDLDARPKGLRVHGKILERRRFTVDRVGLLGLNRTLFVDRLADDVQDAAENLATDRNLNRLVRVHDFGSANEAVRRIHGDATNRVLAQVLSDFENKGRVLALVRHRDLERRVNRGKLGVRELDVHDGTKNLDHTSVVMMGRCHFVSPQPLRASAPPIISISSLVIDAWRTRFASSVKREII